MKHLATFALAAMFIGLVTLAAVAGDEAKAPETKTLTGEIVDTGCYLGHGARGADHQSCAARCIANGMPMALLTDDGSLYLLTMNHDNADPFNEAKKMAAHMVMITGPVMERNGMKAIEVTAVKEASGKGAKADAKKG